MIVDRHPVLRNAALVVCALFAAAAVVLSAAVSSHSVLWLLSFLLATGSLLVSLRRRPRTPLSNTYSFYLAQLSGYLLAVWILHVSVPGKNPAGARALFEPFMIALYPAVILQAIAHLRFTRLMARNDHPAVRALEYIGWAGGAYFIVQSFNGTFVLNYVWATYTWVPTLEGGYKPFFYFTTFFLIVGVCVPFAALFKERDTKRRLQLIYYLIGAVPLWASCWINFLISMGFQLYPIGGVAFFFHALVLTYAITFEGLFDLRLSLRRGLAYALVSVALGAVYGGLMWAAPQTGLLDSDKSILTGMLLAIISGFFFAPALNWFQKGIDRVFFRTDVNQQAQLEDFTRKAATTAEAAVLARLLCETLSKLVAPRRIDLYLHANDSFRLFAVYDGALRRTDWPLSEPLSAGMAAGLSQGTQPLKLAHEAPATGIQLSLSSDGLAVPLRQNDRILGCIVLHPRLADEPYAENDTRTIETLAACAATAFEHARTSNELDFLRGLTQQTFDHLAAGILIVARSGKILQHNPAARTLLGTASFASMEALRPAHAELLRAFDAALAESRPAQNFELQLSSKTVLFSSERLGELDGEAIYLLVLNDITAYKQLEDANRRKEALARIGGMIASINHEIRNLLQPTRHQLEQLKTVESADPVFNNAMRVINDRMQSLDRLLLNLKDLSRPIELRRRPISSQALLESAWSDVRSQSGAERVGWQFNVRPGAESVDGDGQWLRQVFVNLMKNAVEAMGNQPQPQLHVEVTDAQSAITFCVRDNGGGMSDEARANLFEPFFSTKAEAGTGLGLSISRRIVELHGGSIDVASQDGQSTTFQVKLPRPKNSSEEPNAA